MAKKGYSTQPKKSDLKAKENSKNNKKQAHNNMVENRQKRPQFIPKLPLVYVDGMTVSEISEVTKRSIPDIIKELMKLGVLASQNHSIDSDTAELLADALGIEFKVDESKDLTNFEKIEIEDDPKDLVPRSPVVTIMGHVDHGKTTLLDTIRSSRITSTEAGGITQAIGAYQVKRNDKLITFIDTPGHAAFTEMRARGAQVTDIVVLVVAADDGVMPQTKEAIDHANASKCPIIVAVNKCDKPQANPDRCMQELSELGILPEDWGGDVPFVKISALRGTNVPLLLDTIQLVAEMEEYKANPNREAIGYVIESKLDKNKGPQATLLIKNGTLHVSDYLMVGNTWGKIKAMYDDMGRLVKEAGPSTPVSVIGLQDVPQAGDKFMVLNDERKVKKIAEARKEKSKLKSIESKTIVSLDSYSRDKDETPELKLLVKADTSGSAEALKASLEKISIDGAKLSIIRASVGQVTENDVLLAQASKAVIIAFNVASLSNVKDLAKLKGIEIRNYNIIYKCLEDIEAAMKGMLSPVYEDVNCGEARVLEVYKASKVGTIAGCMVDSGYVRRGAMVQVLRDGVQVYKSTVSSLKRFKDDAKEVKAGFDCGLTIANYNDIKIGDVLIFSVTEEVSPDEA